MVKRIDEAFGRLQDALESLSLLENTVILFTSDHGCHFKTRNSEYKRSCHESSIRVPTALQGPGFDGGGRINELVSLVDLPPTLLDAASLPIPDNMSGRSILHLVNKEQVEWNDDVFIQISESQVGRSVRTHRWKYGVTAPEKNGNEHATSELYVEQYLYDLKADPYELHKLAGAESHQKVRQVMRERIVKRIQQIEKIEVTIQPAEKRTINQQLKVSANEAHS
jgi:arylsulfatase A-like enzyme